MARMAEQTEIRVGFPGTSTVRTIHESALGKHLDRGFFRVDPSGAPVSPDGKTKYKLDDAGDPIIPEPTEAELAEKAKIVRPPTDEYVREQRAAEAEKAAAADKAGTTKAITTKSGSTAGTKEG